MRGLRCLWGAAALLVVLGLTGSAQRRLAPDAGCVQQRGEYVCNWSALKLALEDTHTIAVQASPRDRMAASQLGELVQDLRKTPAAPGQPGDLTLTVLPVEATGVNLGPADHELLTLRVYAPSSTGDQGVLLWVETLRGPGDRPWPAQVHAVIEQFKGHLHGG